MKPGICKVRGISRGINKGSWLLCLGNEDAKQF